MKLLTQIIATATLVPILAMPCYAGRQHKVYQEHSSSTQQYSQQTQPVKQIRKANLTKNPKKSYTNKKMPSNEIALRNASSLGGAVSNSVSPSNIIIAVIEGISLGIYESIRDSFKKPIKKKSSLKSSK